jgi:hypothetical protein
MHHKRLESFFFNLCISTLTLPSRMKKLDFLPYPHLLLSLYYCYFNINKLYLHFVSHHNFYNPLYCVLSFDSSFGKLNERVYI